MVFTDSLRSVSWCIKVRVHGETTYGIMGASIDSDRHSLICIGLRNKTSCFPMHVLKLGDACSHLH